MCMRLYMILLYRYVYVYIIEVIYYWYIFLLGVELVYVHNDRIPLVFSVGILSFEIIGWFQLYVGLHPVRLDYMP